MGRKLPSIGPHKSSEALAPQGQEPVLLSLEQVNRPKTSARRAHHAAPTAPGPNEKARPGAGLMCGCLRSWLDVQAGNAVRGSRLSTRGGGLTAGRIDGNESTVEALDFKHGPQVLTHPERNRSMTLAPTPCRVRHKSCLPGKVHSLPAKSVKSFVKLLRRDWLMSWRVVGCICRFQFGVPCGYPVRCTQRTTSHKVDQTMRKLYFGLHNARCGKCGFQVMHTPIGLNCR